MKSILEIETGKIYDVGIYHRKFIYILEKKYYDVNYICVYRHEGELLCYEKIEGEIIFKHNTGIKESADEVSGGKVIKFIFGEK